MGLDNGIMIRGKNHKNLKLPHWTNDFWSNDTEICYWRKFWGFRNEMVEEFHQKEECDDIELTIDDLPKVIELLEQFLEREYFEDNADSPWTYEEYLIYIIRNIENINALIDYMEDHPEVTCYFYDSY